jgi:hypothetical protein
MIRTFRQELVEVMRILVYSPSGAPFLCLHASICERSRPSIAPFELLELLNFHFDMDPDPAISLMRIRIQLNK